MISLLSNSSLKSLKQRSSLCLGKEMERVTNKTTRVPVAWENVLSLNFKHKGHSVEIQSVHLLCVIKDIISSFRVKEKTVFLSVYSSNSTKQRQRFAMGNQYYCYQS